MMRDATNDALINHFLREEKIYISPPDRRIINLI